MPIGGRNRKRESSPTNERPAKRQRIDDNDNYDLRTNVLAAYAATATPRKSRRGLVNSGPMTGSGNRSAEPQGVADDEQPVQIKEEGLLVSQLTRIVPHNKRTYGRKGGARAVHQGTDGASTSPSNVDTSRNPNTEEEKEELVALTIVRRGAPRQKPRGKLAAEETHEGARDRATVGISHSREPPKSRHSTKHAKNASRQSLLAERAYDLDASAAPEPEHPLISHSGSSNVNRPCLSPALATDRSSPSGAQSRPPDEVDGGSIQSVEVPVSHLPKKRRGRPKNSKIVPKEESPSKRPTQPVNVGHQSDSVGSNREGIKEQPSPSPKKASRALPRTPSPPLTPQSKRQTFDCVLLPSPRKFGTKLAEPPAVTKDATLPHSQTGSPIPNAAGSKMATLRRTLQPVPGFLPKDEIIEDEDGGQSPSKRVEKRAKRISSISRSDQGDGSEGLPARRGTRSATIKKGKETTQVIRQGRGWVIIEEDTTPDEESAYSSKDERVSGRASIRQARQPTGVFTPAKARSKRRSPVKKQQTRKTPQRVKSVSPILSSPSNPFDSSDQSEATTDAGSESEIDAGAETETTSYSLKFSGPLVAQSPGSTTTSLAVPVPSDFETDVEEPEEYTPAIRKSSAITPSVMGDAAQDDPEMELDEPDFRPVVSPSKVLRGPLPHHLYRFVPLQKRAVLQRLRNPPYVELGGGKAVNDAGKELRGLLEGTMERGEGNSCLILGPRGSGKSLLVETTLREAAKKAIIIRLSGYAQATDRHAMREIAYQLNHQTGSSFNLPEEDAEDVTPDGEEDDLQWTFAPPAAYLPTLISQLPTLSRPVIVLLDAFDLFAQHPRQALLYCLLDTVQSCRAGAGRNGLLVAGMTTKVNCVNLLEKRVKSRFSQRVLRVSSLTSLDNVVHFVNTILSPGLERLEPEEAMEEWNRIWTDGVQRFLAHSDVRATLWESFGLRSDPGHILQLLIPVVLDFDIEHPRLSSSSLISSAEAQQPSRFEFISYLPQTVMWLLVSAYKWETAGHPIFNFSMLWKAFKLAAAEAESAHLVVSVPGTVRSIKTTSILPETLQGAFEQLVEIRVFQPVLGTGASVTGAGREFIKYRCTIPREEVRRLAEKHGSTDVKSWLASATALKM